MERFYFADDFLIGMYCYAHFEGGVAAVLMGTVWDVIIDEKGDFEVHVWTNWDATDDVEQEFRTYWFNAFGIAYPRRDGRSWYLTPYKQLQDL